MSASDAHGTSLPLDDELATRDTLIERSGSAPAWLVPPFTVGRYLVTEKIGLGGAGVVFRARDPELDREVAIKIVVSRTGGDKARQGLLREAQAIAKLSHPNVVAVYDVGELPIDENTPPAIYMVMELLEGVSLRQWLRGPPQPLGELLDVLLEAGRGLEAAHRAGLVHRDFKPENVLIGPRVRAGIHGRVHVLDFGLAQQVATSSSADSTSSGLVTLTVSGTPAYMAPEQHAGAPNDERTDLFAFCATCWEALHGVQPYTGRTLAELERSKARGCGPAPTRRPPRWLHDVIARGLEPDPARRPASMTALLSEIERRRHRRRNLAFGAIGVGVIGGAFALAWSQRTDADACVEQSERSLAVAWNDGAREKARAQFDSFGLPYADDTWVRVQSVIDERANAWREARSRACEAALGGDATAVAQSAAALGCLDDQLDELGARVEMFAVADRDVVRQAARMAERMPRPERCLDAAWVAAEHDGFGGDLEAELLRVRLQHEMGHYEESLAGARAVAEAAAKAGDHRREARALLQACRSLGRNHQAKEATAQCTDAWVAAERANATGVVISAMLQLVNRAGPDQEEEAERLVRLIRARLDARPPDEREPGLEADFALSVAQRRRQAGRWVEAQVEAQRSYDIWVETRGEEDPVVVPALNELALTAEELGEIDRAREIFARASGILLATRGSTHPDVVSLENNVAGLEISLGRHEDALARLERVLAAKRALDGDRSAWLLTSMYQQVDALVRLGRSAPALTIAREGLTLAESLHGGESAELLAPLVAMSWSLRADDRCDEALIVLDRIATIAGRATTPDLEIASFAELERARCVDRMGRHVEAGAHYERAVTLAETLYGKQSRRVAEALLARAPWEREHGSRELAATLLERAAQICATTEGDPALGRAVEAERARLR